MEPGSPLVERRTFQSPWQGRAGCEQRRSSIGGDRFIPDRRTSSISAGYHRLLLEELSSPCKSGAPPRRQSSCSDLINSTPESRQKRLNSEELVFSKERILHFSSAKSGNVNFSEAVNSPFGSLCRESPSPRKTTSRQSIRMDAVYDMPDVTMETFSSPMSWSSRDNLAVALGQQVFNRKSHDGCVTSLDIESSEVGDITAICWDPSGRYLAIGSIFGFVQVCDLEENKTLKWSEENAASCNHVSSVSAISWDQSTPQCFYGGKQCGCVEKFDLTNLKSSQVFATHIGGICGLEVSRDGRHLATGGDDKLLCVWNISEKKCVNSFEVHDGPVKAIAWCPWRGNRLYSGSCGEDGTIRAWNIDSGQLLCETVTGSQVTSMTWSMRSKHLVTGHGDPIPNVQLHDYKDLRQVSTLSGHRDKVLKLDFNPSGKKLASLGADETLRTWDGFGEVIPPIRRSSLSALMSLSMTIR